MLFCNNIQMHEKTTVADAKCGRIRLYGKRVAGFSVVPRLEAATCP